MTKEITTGQDSFLDIVANLVGILIILVVVVGAQASQQLQTVTHEDDREEEISSMKVAASTADHSVAKLRKDNAQLEHQIVEENRLTAALTVRRHQMLVELELINQATQKKKDEYVAKLANIDESERKKQIELVSFEQTKRQLTNKLATLEEELNAVQTSGSPKKETIDHYPNPIAKTVFAEEIHFRLADGKLSFVPMEELIATMKAEWKVKAEKLTQAEATVETVGPIAGYRLQYQLAAENIREQSEFGVLQRRSVEFQRFVIFPQSSLIGESVDVAMRGGSDFQRRLEGMTPERTTVSIWVYPDGFGDHSKIKTWLHENGYQMASWPLSPGRPISGGPKGFKTSAQ